MKINFFFIVSIIFFLVACSHKTTYNKETVMPLASSLTKLSTAVESAVRYKNPPENINEARLLIYATEHDPRLVKPFKGYRIRILRQKNHAAVLVCTKDGKFALLEDAGCTGKMDNLLWELQPRKVCEFTINLQEVCQE